MLHLLESSMDHLDYKSKCFRNFWIVVSVFHGLYRILKYISVEFSCNNHSGNHAHNQSLALYFLQHDTQERKGLSLFLHWRWADHRRRRSVHRWSHVPHRTYRSHHRTHRPHRSHHRWSHAHHRRWHRSMRSHHHRSSRAHWTSRMHTRRWHHSRRSLGRHSGSWAKIGAEIRRRRYRRALVGREGIGGDLTGLESGRRCVDQVLGLLLHPFLVEILDVILVLATLAMGLPHARWVMCQVSVAIVAIVFRHRCASQ